MASRDIWSHGSGRQLADLISSVLATLLLDSDPRPAYFSSPWLSDFLVFENRFREFGALFPEFADGGQVWFADFLPRLARRRSVRLITTRQDISLEFVARIRAARIPNLE